MKKIIQKRIKIISLLIAVLSAVATFFGIFSDFGEGSYTYESIRGRTIEIYGTGIYQHMSADVAVQGIAQDYVTIFVAVPVLLLSLIASLKGRNHAMFILAGVLAYFFVTYLFYIAMGMYNIMFLIYATLLCLSFFGLFITTKSLFQLDLSYFSWTRVNYKFVGWFLIINASLIGVLWLSIIIPPLLDGSIYPAELNHYTTLIVQGFDLGLLLPICFVSGLLFLKKRQEGLIYATVYIIFLAILMLALSAKIVAMGLIGANIFPVVFIIPTITLLTIIITFYLLRKIKNENTTAQQGI